MNSLIEARCVGLTPSLNLRWSGTKNLFAAATVLVTTTWLAAFAQASDPSPSPTPVLMPTGPGNGTDTGPQPFDPNPRDPASETNKIQVYGVDPLGNTVTKKTIRFTNNTGKTVFPMLRSPNNKTMASNDQKGLYDPFDPPNREYRGYIGYQDPNDGKYYFGLKPGESILVDIPFVYWNGARVHIGTEAEFIWRFGDVNNPLRNRATGRRSITLSALPEDSTASNSIPNGVVMWYRNDVPPGVNPPADAVASESPSDDSHDQIAEFTIRDNPYLVKISAQSNNEIPDTEIVTLMNYDVSNVDNLFLPMAMAANDVWIVPNKTIPGNATDPSRPNLTGGYEPGSVPEPVGWTGAIGTIAELQGKIQLFTAGNNTLLGNYFGGKGWPFYNFPGAGVDPTVPLKIPSGANIFPGSPMKGDGARSSFDNDKYMLSSGGTGSISAALGVSGDQTGLEEKQIRLSPGEPQSKVDFIEIGQIATGGPIPGNGTTTTVTAIDRTNRVVTLSNSWVGSIVGDVVTFTRPKDDYASLPIIRLWFSWVKYYLSQWHAENPQAPALGANKTIVIDKIGAREGTMFFTEPQPELAVGMVLEGPGLNLTETTTEKGLAMGLPVILEVAQDKKSVIISQVPAQAYSNVAYTFYPPTDPKAKIRYTPTTANDPGYPLFGEGDKPAFSFPAQHQKGQDPWEFSESVFLAMVSLNQIGQPNSDDVFKAMQNIIGGNMGFIYNQPAKDSADGQMLIAKIRDRIKSILRGVSDFTVYGEFDETVSPRVRLWYPDPKEDKWGTGFNIYNLDPYVWFVHEVLNFTGYGFSLDDDTAQVGAGGANQLQLSITLTNGLVNPVQWEIQTPWGAVLNKRLPYSGPGTDTNGEFIPYDISNITVSPSGPPIRITTGQPHKFSNGQRIAIEAVEPANHPANGKFKVGNVSKFAFDLFVDNESGTTPVHSSIPATANGNCYALPRFSFVDTTGPGLPGNDLSTVYYRVLGDDALGTFLGAPVTIADLEGKVIPQPVQIRVTQPRTVASGRLMFNANVMSADGTTPLPAGNYTFSFGNNASPTPTPTPEPTATPTPDPTATPTPDPTATPTPDPTATPTPDPTATPTPTVTPTPTPTPVPVAKLVGSYTGVIGDLGAMSPSTPGSSISDDFQSVSGDLDLTINGRGAVTASATIDGDVFRGRGKLDGNQSVSLKLSRRGSTDIPLALELVTNSNGAQYFRGSVATTPELDALAGWQNFSRRAPLVKAGPYTLLMPLQTASVTNLLGTGVGSVNISPTGTAVFSSFLADGTRLNGSFRVWGATGNASEAIILLSSALYRGNGHVGGWLTLTTENVWVGLLDWNAPAASSGGTAAFASGFTATLNAILNPYKRPTRGVSVINWPSNRGVVRIAGGGLSEGRSLQLNLGSNNQLRVVDPVPVGVSFNPSIQLGRGTMTGTFVLPSLNGRQRILGVLDQSNNSGAGFFLNDSGSGRLIFAPATP